MELEEYIESAILTWLMSQWVSADKIVSGWWYDSNKWIYRKQKSQFARRGISDIVWVLPWGRALYIEVKKPSEMQFFDSSEEEMKQRMQDSRAHNKNRYVHALEQIKFLTEKRSLGAVAFFSSSVDQTRQRMEEQWVVFL